MRYRLAKIEDLSACHELLGSGFRASRRIHQHLEQLWEGLLTAGIGGLSVIEDAERRSADAIQAFGACVFVSDSFASEHFGAPGPYLAAIIYERILDNRSPVLTPAQIRSANSGPGLNLVCLHFALRNPCLGEPETRHVLQVANAAFFFFFAGYRLNTLMQEVYGAEHAAYMQGGGLRLRADFQDYFARAPARPTAQDHPYLFGMRKEEVFPAAVNPLSHLFHSLPPRFGFSGAAQRVLQRAMLSETDSEIAADLGISQDAVKKTWRLIYQRVDDAAPHLFRAVHPTAHLHRSGERRRHLLDYLRTHLEELRPVNAARRGMH